MSKINIKEIVTKLKKKSRRTKTSLYLNAEVYKKFLVKCKSQDVSGSKVIEEFMSEFAESD